MSLGDARQESPPPIRALDPPPGSLKYVRRRHPSILEFIAQFLELIHCARTPGILSGNTAPLRLKRAGGRRGLPRAPPRRRRWSVAAKLIQDPDSRCLRVAVEGAVFAPPRPRPPGLARAALSSRQNPEAPSLAALERSAFVDAGSARFHALFGGAGSSRPFRVLLIQIVRNSDPFPVF